MPSAFGSGSFSPPASSVSLPSSERQRELAVEFAESLRYLEGNFFKGSEEACLSMPEQEQAPEQEVAGVKRPKLLDEFVPSTNEVQARGSSHEQELQYCI